MEDIAARIGYIEAWEANLGSFWSMPHQTHLRWLLCLLAPVASLVVVAMLVAINPPSKL